MRTDNGTWLALGGVTALVATTAIQRVRERGSVARRSRHYDQPAYTHYVVGGRPGDLRIESGWEYVSDARDRGRDYRREVSVPGGIAVGVYTRRGLLRMGIDARDDARWGYGLQTAGYGLRQPHGSGNDADSYEAKIEWVDRGELVRDVEEAASRTLPIPGTLGEDLRFWRFVAEAVGGSEIPGGILFPDGTELDDWSRGVVHVESISIDPLGLAGTVTLYRLRVVLPRASRWDPQGA